MKNSGINLQIFNLCIVHNRYIEAINTNISSNYIFQKCEQNVANHVKFKFLTSLICINVSIIINKHMRK